MRFAAAGMALLLAGCGGGFAWNAEVVFDAGIKLGACAIGDLDSEAGGEIVAVSQTGEIHVIRKRAGTWTAVTAFKAPGEMIQCAVGDADPDRPGNEIVAVGIAAGSEDDGGPGAAYLIRKEGDRWIGRHIFEDTALLHAVCITPEGVFVAGYANRVTLLRIRGEKVQTEPIADLPGSAKSAVPYQGGAAFACTDGSLVHVTGSASRWKATPADKRDSRRSRIGTDGSRLIASDDDGTLSIIDAGARETVFKDSSKLRGGILADLDPSSPGLEAATAGYSKAVTVFYRKTEGWEPRVVFTDTDRYHHLAVGDLDGTGGPDLAACGYSGRVVVVACQPVR